MAVYLATKLKKSKKKQEKKKAKMDVVDVPLRVNTQNYQLKDITVLDSIKEHSFPTLPND